jgi:hypothetical protein
MARPPKPAAEEVAFVGVESPPVVSADPFFMDREPEAYA